MGGQLLIVRGRWARTLFNFYEDPTQLGIVTALTHKAQNYDVMVLSSYWPIPALNSDNDQLWTKANRALHSLGSELSPLEFAKSIIHRKLLKHCRQPNNVALLTDDLNSV